jgi:hypothetical protein
VPSAAEIVAIKRKCAETIADVLPPAVAVRFFAVRGVSAESRRELLVNEVEGMLDVLGDAYMNRHLVFNIVELVVVRILPEMGEKGVGVLMKERLGDEKV